MRTVKAAIAAIILAAMLVAPVVAAKPVASSSATCTFAPNPVLAGERVSITAAGLPAGEFYVITLGAGTYYSTVNSSGNALIYVAAPASPGTYTATWTSYDDAHRKGRDRDPGATCVLTVT